LAIRAQLRRLQTDRGRKQLQEKTVRFLSDTPSLKKYSTYPGVAADFLFPPPYRHMHPVESQCEICSADSPDQNVCGDAVRLSCEDLGCDITQCLLRHRLGSSEFELETWNDAHSIRLHPPAIHIGKMASGDTVMKSAEHRDSIARSYDVIAFEMEGLGVWDYFPSLVIKGVCDYSDSHKHKKWQTYAAGTAAACTKAFLDEWRSDPLTGKWCWKRAQFAEMQLHILQFKPMAA